MKIQKLLVLASLGLGMLTVATAPVMAKGAALGTHKGNGMAHQLGLTKDQKSQLKPIRQQSRAQIAALKADTTLSKKERKSRLRAIRAQRLAKTNALLSSSQQQQLAQMRATRRNQKRIAKGKA